MRTSLSPEGPKLKMLLYITGMFCYGLTHQVIIARPHTLFLEAFKGVQCKADHVPLQTSLLFGKGISREAFYSLHVAWKGQRSQNTELRTKAMEWLQNQPLWEWKEQEWESSPYYRKSFWKWKFILEPELFTESFPGLTLFQQCHRQLCHHLKCKRLRPIISNYDQTLNQAVQTRGIEASEYVVTCNQKLTELLK